MCLFPDEEREKLNIQTTLADNCDDYYLGSDLPLGCPPEKLFQGPIADALTHVGQIAMLRRLAGAPIRGENYFRARISADRVGADQPAAVQEFE